MLRLDAFQFCRTNRRPRLGSLCLKSVDSLCKTRLLAGGGILVHRARRRNLIELTGDHLQLLLCCRRVAGLDHVFKPLNTGLDFAFSSAVDRLLLGILPNSFFGR